MDDRMEQMAKNVEHIRDRVDDLSGNFSDHRVEVERRLSTLEVKSGVWGILGGMLSGVALHLKGR